MSVLFMFLATIGAVAVTGLLMKLAGATLRLVEMREQRERLGLYGEKVSKALEAKRCDACGGFCDGDMEKCFANMELAADAVVGGGVSSGLTCRDCGDALLQTNDFDMHYCSTCEKFCPRVAAESERQVLDRMIQNNLHRTIEDRGPGNPGVRVDIQTQRTSISVRGGGNVSVSVEEFNDLGRDVGRVELARLIQRKLDGPPDLKVLSRPEPGTFEPSRHRSD